MQTRLCPQLGCLTRETALSDNTEDEIISNDNSIPTYLRLITFINKYVNDGL